MGGSTLALMMMVVTGPVHSLLLLCGGGGVGVASFLCTYDTQTASSSTCVAGEETIIISSMYTHVSSPSGQLHAAHAAHEQANRGGSANDYKHYC